MCRALHPSLLARRMSAPNFTSSFTNSRLPSITDWCSAVCPSGPKEFTLNSQFVMFCKREWSSLLLPFLSASWNTLWRAEQVMSAWLMISTGRDCKPSLVFLVQDNAPGLRPNAEMTERTFTNGKWTLKDQSSKLSIPPVYAFRSRLSILFKHIIRSLKSWGLPEPIPYSNICF